MYIAYTFQRYNKDLWVRLDVTVRFNRSLCRLELLWISTTLYTSRPRESKAGPLLFLQIKLVVDFHVLRLFNLLLDQSFGFPTCERTLVKITAFLRLVS